MFKLLHAIYKHWFLSLFFPLYLRSRRQYLASGNQSDGDDCPNEIEAIVKSRTRLTSELAPEFHIKPTSVNLARRPSFFDDINDGVPRAMTRLNFL